MSLVMPTSQQWAADCAADGEFRLAARHWTGRLRLLIGGKVLALSLSDGAVSGGDAAVGDLESDDDVLEFEASQYLWEKLLAAVPPRLHNDIGPLLSSGLTRRGDRLLHAQYFPAVMRAIELLRPPGLEPSAMRDEGGAAYRVDAPVGRYVHLELGGHDHRIYFEEAGSGIPLLLQHTAGSHGSQWRHLFEVPEITDHFRLIAYDLPFHGKSLPPVGKEWWAEPYQLDGAFLRSVPVTLARALALDNPVFMGCSVGGLLALDLALHHPDLFRAVISLEGTLNIEDELSSFPEFWHPQVSNEYKSRLMDGLMSPTSPVAYRKETTFVYASGWPPLFLGDLHYYMKDYDLREKAADIDTSRVGVHILSGEYDWSGSAELGRAAHEAILGSTWRQMAGVGHFPMSENPVEFVQYLLPVLQQIRAESQLLREA